MNQLNSEMDRSLSGDEVVISGMSGLYPEAHNLKELSNILYNKVNPVNDENCRWDYSHPEGTYLMGKVQDIAFFDSQFFNVHYELSHAMDPMARKMYEHTYQAIFDAGINPQHLKGKKVAVFVAAAISESEGTCIYKYVPKSRYSLMGSCRTMFANRISYWLDTIGPSVAINEACCGSIRALEQAYQAIKSGECEAAIVGASNLRLLPHACIHYRRLIDINNDGKTKSFDQNADGCNLSDAVNVLFLQKAKHALRVYAEVKHVKCEFLRLMEENMSLHYELRRKPGAVTEFLERFYEEAQVSPQAVEYVEALGLATPDLDKMELEAFENVFTKNRSDPLYIGSVTSNIGFTEAASGISSIHKVLLGYEKGTMAANLNYISPRQDIKAIREGAIQVVAEHQRVKRTYTAVNGMSVNGSNSHVLLDGHYKQKDLSAYKSPIPYMALISARQEAGVDKIKEELKSHPVDQEELALLHHIHSMNISGHLARGYVILDETRTKAFSLAEKSVYYDDTKRPLWFVFSGMGSQWPGMGTQLMRIPMFAASIERLQRVLEPKGVDIINIITSKDDIFSNVLNSFVGIVAIQIGLTDILSELGLKPDGMIGHSTGELVCAYMDGCLTAEETILGAYYRGLVSIETPLTRGAMAAVGLGYQEISRLCPPDITVACHNGTNSSTISGPIDQMKDFVAALTAKGIFARNVPSGNIAYHSQYIRAAALGLIKYMSQVIKKPKLRSKRWVSTSVEKDKLNEFNSKYCTAEYFTNNFVNPVLFAESLQQVPQNAVLVEIAPHGLLQAILKRSLPNDCRNIALTRRQYPDNVVYLLQAIGNLYVLGYNPKIEVLYPKVHFPVSTGTPMLSHLIQWVHEERWKHLCFSDTDMIPAMANNFLISYQDDEYSYLRGHVIRGATVFPFAAALTAAWDVLLMSSDIEKQTKSVEFRNLQLFVQPLLLEHRPTRLTVAINKGSGWFEITEEQFKYKVVTGYIRSELTESFEKDLEMYDNHEEMSGKDIYQLLQDRDYSYSGEFRSIEKANSDLSQAELVWCNNWVPLIDGMLQLNALRQPHHAVSLPTYIRKMSIDVEKHMHTEKNCLNGKNVLKAMIFDDNDFSRCGGVTIHNIKFRNVPPRKPDELKIKVSKLPYSTNSEQETHCTSEDPQKLSLIKMPVLALKSKEIGNLDSLQWVESSTKISGVPVNVHYVGINKYDVDKAIGATESEFSNVSYGMDFSGTLKSGERVMGIVKSGAASTLVMAQPELVWPVPEHWSLEDAATVPHAYAQALYLLKIKVQLNPGMTVFIEGGAGALGQAVISIALASQCRVFTSVSDCNKKQLLLKLFPQLKDEFIFNSRHFTYVDDLNIATNGRCDVIISYSKGLLKNLLLKSVAGDGTFLDLVQIYDREDFVFGMNHLTKARSYAAVDLSSIFSHHQTEMQTLQELLANGIIHGYIRPLSRVTYASHESTRAFKLLMARKNCGRVLLRMDSVISQTIPSVVCAPDACQLILIDDQVLSMRLAERLVAKGARSLYIACDKVTLFHLFKARTWNHKGVKANFFNKNLRNSQDITSLLKNATNIGPVEGIYLSLTEERDKCTSELDIINYVDSTSRCLCPQLKYFVILTTNGIEAKNIYLSRSKCNLPITILDFLALSEVKDYYLTLIDVVEQAIGSTQTAKVVQIEHIQKRSILDQLNSIAGLNLYKQNGIKTLAEIGVKNNKIPTIQSLLRDTYNKFLSEEEVYSLTINELTKLNDILEGTIKSLQGLQNLFSHVGSDEHLATAPIVSLPTLAKNITEMDKIEIDQTYFYIIPGTEGLYERFRELCERLKLPAVVLQPGLDHPHETIQQTAKRYSQVILNASKCLDSFCLLGYESGVLVALELAAILEDQGFTGTVFCLGFAPDEFQIEFEKILSEYKTVDDLQDSILRHIFTLLTGKDTVQLEKALQGTSAWKQKVDACIRCLLGRKTQSTQFVRAFIEASLARIEQVRRYSVTPFQLQSRLVLLRAATKHVVPSQSALQQFSSQPVDVYQLRLPLAHAQNDTLIAPIINKYLSSEILNSFNMKNVCNVYVNTTVLDPFLI